MFCGLMSRWMTPRSWAKPRAGENIAGARQNEVDRQGAAAVDPAGERFSIDKTQHQRHMSVMVEHGVERDHAVMFQPA